METVISLGDTQTKGMRMLELACRKCERRGRFSLSQLIAEHSRDDHGDLRALIPTIALSCRTPASPSTSAAAFTPRVAEVVFDPTTRRRDQINHDPLDPENIGYPHLVRRVRIWGLHPPEARCMEFRTKLQVLDTLASKLAALPESHPHHLRLSRMVSDLRREIERAPRPVVVSVPGAGD